MPRIAKPEKGVFERVPGSGNWYARFIHDGQKVVKSFGTDRQAASEYLRDIRAKKRIAPDDIHLQVKRNRTTVGQLCDLLLDRIKTNPTRYRDQRNPPQRIEAIRSVFGERPADSIRPWEISDWLESMDWSAGTQNRYRTMFSSLYQLGKHRDLVKTNPVRDVKQARVGGGVVRFLSWEEEDRLRAVLQKRVDNCSPTQSKLRQQAQHRIYELDVALGTGMRKGEQYSLKWTDVDFTREVITLRDTKNGSSREVDMITDVIAALRGLEAFTNDLHTLQPGNVFRNGENKKWWLAALKEAKITNLRWHDLRHTFCSRLAQSGASLKHIQEAAGHKTIQMSARYAHLDKTSRKNAMAVLNRQKLPA